jgi:uncharacterized membrane protein YhiD involved in acid resistance
MTNDINNKVEAPEFKVFNSLSYILSADTDLNQRLHDTRLEINLILSVLTTLAGLAISGGIWTSNDIPSDIGALIALILIIISTLAALGCIARRIREDSQSLKDSLIQNKAHTDAIYDLWNRLRDEYEQFEEEIA